MSLKTPNSALKVLFTSEAQLNYSEGTWFAANLTEKVLNSFINWENF